MKSASVFIAMNKPAPIRSVVPAGGFSGASAALIMRHYHDAAVRSLPASP